MKIEMSIWDNENSINEKQDILLYCEHCLNNAWSDWYNGPAPIKYRRWWGGFEAEVDMQDAHEFMALIHRYNDRLTHLAYWNRTWNGEERLVMEIDWGRA